MEAEDLAQEAILATLAGWERIRDKEKRLSYMMGVVNNRVMIHQPSGLSNLNFPVARGIFWH